MKNVTISLSNDLVQVLDNLCKDCDLSRYAFAKEAILEKIERHSKNVSHKEEKESSKKVVDSTSEEDHGSEPPFLW
jgi:predicted transcriptional regulator